MTSSTDMLSLSPSLLNILSYLHYRDIPKCKLVNGRIRDVIRRNRARLPKQTANMTIRSSSQEQHDCCIEVFSRLPIGGRAITITESSITSNMNYKMQEYYQERGDRFRVTAAQDLSPIEQSLAEVLSIMFEFYFVVKINIGSIQDGEMKSLKHAIGEVIQLIPNAKNPVLDVGTAWTGLAGLARHTRPKWIFVEQGHLGCKEFFSYLPYKYTRKIYLCLETEEDKIKQRNFFDHHGKTMKDGLLLLVYLEEQANCVVIEEGKSIVRFGTLIPRLSASNDDEESGRLILPCFEVPYKIQNL